MLHTRHVRETVDDFRAGSSQRTVDVKGVSDVGSETMPVALASAGMDLLVTGTPLQGRGDWGGEGGCGIAMTRVSAPRQFLAETRPYEHCKR